MAYAALLLVSLATCAQAQWGLPYPLQLSRVPMPPGAFPPDLRAVPQRLDQSATPRQDYFPEPGSDQAEEEEPEAAQFHSQDVTGRSVFGYLLPDQVRVEARTADGVVRGSYSYLDPNGNTVKVQYWDEGNGFHAAGSHIPAMSLSSGTNMQNHHQLFQQTFLQALRGAGANVAVPPNLSPGDDNVVVDSNSNSQDDGELKRYPDMQNFPAPLYDPSHVHDANREAVIVDNPSSREGKALDAGEPSSTTMPTETKNEESKPTEATEETPSKTESNKENDSSMGSDASAKDRSFKLDQFPVTYTGQFPFQTTIPQIPLLVRVGNTLTAATSPVFKSNFVNPYTVGNQYVYHHHVHSGVSSIPSQGSYVISPFAAPFRSPAAAVVPPLNSGLPQTWPANQQEIQTSLVNGAPGFFYSFRHSTSKNGGMSSSKDPLVQEASELANRNIMPGTQAMMYQATPQEIVKPDENKIEEIKTEEVKINDVRAEESKTEEVKSEENKQQEEIKTEPAKVEESKKDETQVDDKVKLEQEKGKINESTQEETKQEESKQEEKTKDDGNKEEAKPEVKVEEIKSEDEKKDSQQQEENKQEESKKDEEKAEDGGALKTDEEKKDLSVSQKAVLHGGIPPAAVHDVQVPPQLRDSLPNDQLRSVFIPDQTTEKADN